MKTRWILYIFLLTAAMLSADDFSLVQDGKAANIVIGNYFTTGDYKKTEFSATEAYAATELADYTEKITGVRPSISTQAAQGRPNLYLIHWLWACNPPAAIKIPPLVNQIKADGFLLYAEGDTAYVIAKRPRGVLYGAYEILKKYGDIRWIIPGLEGEYYTPKTAIHIPDQATVINPSFQRRNFNLVCANIGSTFETPKWMLRNNMQPKLYDCDKAAGGHVFSTLLPDTLFPEKPELFGLYKGERLPQSGKILSDPTQYKSGGQANQPCTSNPETKQIMAENLLKNIGQRRADEFVILNNDSIAWCECENCRKLDPPEEAKRGLVSTRFWELANYLIAEGKKAYPNVQFITSAYQTFQEPPKGTTPNKEVLLDFCVHHRCYLHSIGDETCDINTRYRKVIENWQKLGLSVMTYEYTNMMPRAEVIYLPLEGVNTRDLKYYNKIGIIGYKDEAPPYDAVYGKHFATDRAVTESWKANFLVRYLQAYFLWNADADFDHALDDVGSRYYGKAWQEMKKYRTLLRSAYESTDSHFLYGTPRMALGKCLQDESVLRQLNATLDAALLLAKGDTALTSKIESEREYFNSSFVALRKEYLQQQQAPAIANRTTGKIIIDGKFEEADWEKAPAVEDFRVFLGNGKIPLNKTRVRVLYDPENLYFAIESLDLNMDSVTMNTTENDSKQIWNDSNLEFFLSSSAFGYQYLHWVINPRGAVWDAMTYTPLDSQIAFNADAEVKTTIHKDSWHAEIRMPLKALGGVSPKRGDLWRINIARSRNGDKNTKWEGSSWSNGAFHGIDGFRQVQFQ